MNTDISTVNNQPEKTNMNETSATYSPEDNKLRLYIGRVPREEYEKLRSQGWKPLYKQREVGGGDFVATWTPERRDTALSYGDGIILDEDMGPDERAADRAERFGGYRDKRCEEAIGQADKYDAGPAVHGFQSARLAERSVARHDKIADRAVDSWSKAEYWQRRTSGVIQHALYKSSPGVRMGRIKTLEAELRKARASIKEAQSRFDKWQSIANIQDPEKQNQIAFGFSGEHGNYWSEYKHPITGKEGSLRDLMRPDSEQPITGAQAASLFLERYSRPADENDWTIHYSLRIAYENQMLLAQGGRLEQCEIAVGGKIGGMLILKVNKSSATGRVTSVSVLKREKLSGWTYKASNIPGTDWSEYQIDTERLAPGAYSEPTAESLAELGSVKAAIKSANQTKTKIPLINPTDEDAERLQSILNERAMAERIDYYKRNGYSLPVRDCDPVSVLRITQAAYTAHSKGSYASASTRGLFKGCVLQGRGYFSSQKLREKFGTEICEVRQTSGGSTYSASRIIVLTDKPQKPLPYEVWEAVNMEEVNA